MAGRVQLLASGSQDMFFTSDPDYTHFLQSFKKHSNFAREYVNIDPETSVDFGGKARFRLSQNVGDLLTTVSIKMKLPEVLTPLWGYIDSVGHAIIEYADLIVGGKIIQRIPADYLQIYSEHFVTQTKQRALKPLIGKYPERAISSRVSDKEILCHLGASGGTQECFVDLPFYFYNNPELAVPLCVIKKQEVEIEIKLRDYKNLVVKVDGSRPTFTEVLKLINFQVCAEVIFLDPCERLKFESQKRDYIISQIQQNTFDIGQGVQNETFKLEFVNPVKELYFVIQRQGATGTNEGQFMTPFDYDNTLEQTNNKYILFENLDYLTLDLDGQPIITRETGNAIFLKAVQAAIHHSKTQLLRRFYSYSFALEPEKWNPTGQINFSFVKEQILNLSLTPCADYKRQLRVYAISYNIFRVAEETGQTLFNVKY